VGCKCKVVIKEGEGLPKLNQKVLENGIVKPSPCAPWHEGSAATPGYCFEKVAERQAAMLFFYSAASC
jgi:hypothetical protein